MSDSLPMCHQNICVMHLYVLKFSLLSRAPYFWHPNDFRPPNTTAEGKDISADPMGDQHNSFAALLAPEGGRRKQRRKKKAAVSTQPSDLETEASAVSGVAESSIFAGRVGCSADGSLESGGLGRTLSTEKRTLGRQQSESNLRVRTVGSGGEQGAIQRKGTHA